MTHDDLLQFLVDNAERLFFGSIYFVPGKYSVYFWGSEDECMMLYRGLGYGGVHKPPAGPIRGNTHLWYSNGPNARMLARELKPLLQHGGVEAQRRALYCG